MTENHLGRTIAGYHLVRHIGEGGTATVYRGEHPDRGVAAVKLLRPRLAQDPVAVKRFLREAEFGKRFDHPKIVRTYDYGESDGIHYLALEWADGEPLANFVQKSGPLAPTVAAEIIEQIGEALKVSHAAGVIHRDLKPANIMYNPANQEAKLLDFGIARDAEGPQEERLTRAGFFVGSLQYVAPETLSGELVGEQADVYSLATIAYYLLTAQLPFNGRNPRELFQQLLSQDPILLNEAAKDLHFSTELEQVLKRGLARDLATRPKTVDEFSSAFCAAARESSTKKPGFLSSIFKRG